MTASSAKQTSPPCNRAGASVFHAASRALEFFRSDRWHGPRPRPETILEVALVGASSPHRVRVARIIEWQAQRAATARALA